MKRIAIYCVVYNSYCELSRFLESVDVASSIAGSLIETSVFVADNTEVNYIDLSAQYQNIQVHYYPFHENSGYLGGVQRMMHMSQVDSFDYIAISNVDLQMDAKALDELAHLDVDSQTGWIAPCLWSNQLNYDRNPSLLHRYNKSRLRQLVFMFKHPWIDKIYKMTFYKRKKLNHNYPESLSIYAGHGSFMILTSSFIKRCGIPSFPMFLFCEEIYLAEQCREQGLSVKYEPSVKLVDDEHVSVSTIKRNDYYKYKRDSLKFILTTFYVTE